MKTAARLLAFVSCLVAIARADLDLDSNGLGDVWEAKFKPAVLVPSADPDGDGRTNLEECEAGTDPLAPEDIFAIGSIALSGNDLVLRWDSQNGKRYQLQATPTPAVAGSWQPVPGLHSGTGGEVIATTPRPATPKTFFRVVAADVDTDGDGLTDWEEIQAGHDPNVDHATSCGCGTNCNCGPDCACGKTEIEQLTEELQGTPEISIAVNDEEGTEPATAPASDTASFVIKRRAGIARTVVNLSTGGSASATDFTALPTTIVLPLAVKELIVTVTPLPDSLVESDESVQLTLGSGASYSLGTQVSASVLIHDRIQANGTGLFAEFWKHPGTTANAPYFTGPPQISRVDPQINFDNGGTSGAWPGAPITVSGTTSNYFSSRWTGEILPEFSQAYTIFGNANETCRIWINGQLVINNWPPAIPLSGEASAVVPLEGGKRYPIIFEHYNNTGGHRAILSWQSASQAKQVVPQTRLFPNTAPKIFGPYEAMTFIGGPDFNYAINASGRPTSYGASNLPPGLSINSASGLITGSPSVPGTWRVLMTATNAFGSGSAFLEITVIGTSGGITRELWTGVSGTGVAQIPLSTTPTSTSLLTSLESAANSGDNYGARIRGFLTAPMSGDYRFFLRADEAAEFYLADDEEPVNSWKRAELTSPVIATDWSGAAPSPLLRLEGGRRYYLEVRHKEGAGSDHLALGWVLPDQPDSATPVVVPGHVLTRFEDVALGSSPDGTLYFTSLTPQAGAVTNAYGSCTLRLSPDKTTAWVRPNFTGLGSDFFAMHVHDDRLPPTSNIVFDLDEPGVEKLADGSYIWHITGVGTLSAEQIADGIAQHAYLNVHSVQYMNGEIKGYFKPLDGSSSFTAPPAPPDWTTQPAASHTNATAAARFLQQATFGPHANDIAALQGSASFDAWINAEFAKPATKHLPFVEQFRTVTDPNSPMYPGTLTFNSWWKNSIEGPDQLRQRVAFALSEIMVVSENGPLDDRANALSDYYDMLLEHSFGNARDLIEAVTLHPAMGRYLDMLRNDKPSLTAGRIPNENYAREILQLFSLGLNRMHPDGSMILNSHGLPIPVYGQEEIIGYAHVFTGWEYGYAGDLKTSFNASSNWVEPMREVPARHFTGRKRLLNNIVLPGLPAVGGIPLDPYATPNTTVLADPGFQGLARQELDRVHDQLFNHPNMGPFLCRQLIQRLVTSTPSRGYIYRVVSKFNDNGSGVRGDMKAVIKAILLDYEARSIVAASAPGYGKQREPVVRVTQFVRAFKPNNNFAGLCAQDGGLITVDTAPTVHRLVNNQKVMLGFSGPSVKSTDGDYSVTSAIAPTATSFAVRTRDVHRSTWAQAGNVITVTTPVTYDYDPGQSVYIRFRTGGAGVVENGVYSILATPTSSTFTVTAPDAVTRSGDCDVAWLRGSYTQNHTAGVTTLTITCGTLPQQAVGNKLHMTFKPVTGQTTMPPDGLYTIASIAESEPRRFTLTPDSGVVSTLTGRSGTFHAGAVTPVLDRGGSASDIAVSGYSDWNVSSTDTDLGQTPLRAPTVFNFFEPDYQFPGTLAANGLITPEFQISSDTNVIRQANFLFGGIYSHATSTTSSSTYTNGFNHFKAGAHDMMMDFSPWMGVRTSGSDYWTNDANLRALIREFSKVLLAGQMSTAMEDEIYNFTTNATNIAYTAAAPTETQRRNRVRAVLHLIAVSPDFAVQH
jgi:uncharacterized protein (DUF1800 family)